MELSKRIRINFEVSVKGCVTPSITIEDTGTNRSKEDILKEATELLDLALAEAKSRTPKEIK